MKTSVKRSTVTATSVRVLTALCMEGGDLPTMHGGGDPSAMHGGGGSPPMRDIAVAEFRTNECAAHRDVVSVCVSENSVVYPCLSDRRG